MKLSFSWKLGLVVTVLSVSLTSVCVYSLYLISYKALMGQITKNMLHVGRIGALMFDDEARAAIKRLIAATERDSIVGEAEIAAMPPRTTLKSLTQEDIDRYHASSDFQMLLDVLSMVSLATSQDMEPKQSHYRLDEPLKTISAGAFGVYLAVPIKESPNMEVWKYLASSAPLPTSDGWPGNPIGNLAKSWEPLDYLLKGKSFVDDRLYTDEFYTALSAAVPILDQDGSTLAILGIDYAATEERNKLLVLKLFCYGLVAGSLLLSIISSAYLARKLGSSLRLLADAARRVADNDLAVAIDIKSNDEFAMLGRVFNQMVVSIRKYMLALEEKHNQLATIVLDMHDGVGAILTSIVMNSEKHAATDQTSLAATAARLQSVNHLAREGLTEVRFLMNALDYERCDFAVIVEEIRMQGADILAPSGVKLDLRIAGELPRGRMEFREFLELQRIFREAFVNIVKHSDATHCEVSIDFTGPDVAISIADDGAEVGQESKGGGRGLKSMGGRARRLGGTLEYFRRDGFHIKLSLPRSPQSPDRAETADSGKSPGLAN
ncbi:MAG: sigma factor SigB regulation protein [uncultured bacterium]|nr:MAG: sigma factor SigB regulation protein [uncultured bacterium]